MVDNCTSENTNRSRDDFFDKQQFQVILTHNRADYAKNMRLG